jgi:hypothetical protein
VQATANTVPGTGAFAHPVFRRRRLCGVLQIFEMIRVQQLQR